MICFVKCSADDSVIICLGSYWTMYCSKQIEVVVVANCGGVLSTYAKGQAVTLVQIKKDMIRNISCFIVLTPGKIEN